MLRLDRNSKNNEVGRPLVKMSVNWDVISTCRTRTSPMATRSRIKWRSISTCFVLVLNVVRGEVDDADVIAVDESALHQRSVELLK
jgi:hypothetical protein